MFVQMHVDLLPSATDTMKDLGMPHPYMLSSMLWKIHDARVALMNSRLMRRADREEIPGTLFQNFLSHVGACDEGRTAVGRLDPLDVLDRCYLAYIAEKFGMDWLEHPDGSCFTIADLFDYYEAWLSAREQGRSLEIDEWGGALLPPPGWGE